MAYKISFGLKFKAHKEIHAKREKKLFYLLIPYKVQVPIDNINLPIV